LALWAKTEDTTEFCHNSAARMANGAFHFFIVTPLVDMMMRLSEYQGTERRLDEGRTGEVRQEEIKSEEEVP
jgi:hypothetical protein